MSSEQLAITLERRRRWSEPRLSPWLAWKAWKLAFSFRKWKSWSTLCYRDIEAKRQYARRRVLWICEEKKKNSHPLKLVKKAKWIINLRFFCPMHVKHHHMALHPSKIAIPTHYAPDFNNCYNQLIPKATSAWPYLLSMFLGSPCSCM